MHKWEIKPNTDENRKRVIDYSRRCDLGSLSLAVLVNRGLDYEQILEFFDSNELSNPFELKDMQKAADTIWKAVDEGEKICIYGDYDCDGVTSVSLLYLNLQSIGADVSYYIPERCEGYGLNCEAVDKISEAGTKLIITVDNGITAISEAEYIYEKGMKLIVTDHHQPLEVLPKAEAVVNPHRKDCPSEFKDLAGVGVAFKLCAALNDGDYSMMLEQYSDICAIGTIADIVPLKGENRKLVRTGLMYMKNTENEGLSVLIEKSGIKLDKVSSSSVSFGIAPRINAAGRFGSPKTAVEMFVCEDDNSKNFAEELFALNEERKKSEKEIFDEAVEQIRSNPNLLNQRVLVLSGEGWHHGVIGIVSSRILELFGKPNVMISIEEGGFSRGSARSVKGFNIFECLDYCSDLLVKYGGHECAGGLTVKTDDIERLSEKINQFAFENCHEMPEYTLTADKVLEADDFNITEVEKLDLLEPFGECNPRPVFALIGAAVNEILELSGGKHSKVGVSYCGIKLWILIFGKSPSELNLFKGDLADFLVTLEINIYNSVKSITIKAKDWRLSQSKQSQYFAAKKCYESYMRGEEIALNVAKKLAPTREELLIVYKFCKSNPEFNLDNVYVRLLKKGINYAKLRFCIDIFVELKLAEFDCCTQTVKLIPQESKVNLEDSKILENLRKL